MAVGELACKPRSHLSTFFLRHRRHRCVAAEGAGGKKAKAGSVGKVGKKPMLNPMFTADSDSDDDDEAKSSVQKKQQQTNMKLQDLVRVPLHVILHRQTARG